MHVVQISPPDLQLNRANACDTEAPFWIYIYIFQRNLFHPKIMISDDSDFHKVSFPLCTVPFPVLHLTG